MSGLVRHTFAGEGYLKFERLGSISPKAKRLVDTSLPGVSTGSGF